MHSDFVFACADILHENGVSVGVESALNIPKDILVRATEYVDLFMCDLKAVDNELHKSITGVSNEKILENLKLLGALFRHPGLICMVIMMNQLPGLLRITEAGSQI